MVVARENNRGNYTKYTYFAATAVILLSLILGGFYGYTWYRKNAEARAYKDFMQTVEVYNQIEDGNAENSRQKLEDALKAFQTGAQRHKNSSLQPFFAIYQANVYARLNNLKQAIDVLQNNLGNLDQSSPIFYQLVKHQKIHYQVLFLFLSYINLVFLIFFYSICSNTFSKNLL